MPSPIELLAYHPWRSQRITLWTRLSPEVCAERLRANLAPARRPGPGKFRGFLKGRKFTLGRKGTRRNGFKPVAQGRLSEEAGGTLLRITLAPPIAVRIMLLYWFGFAFAALALGLWGSLRARTPWGVLPLLALFPLLGGAIMLCGGYLARDDAEYLRANIAEICEARALPGSSPSGSVP